MPLRSFVLRQSAAPLAPNWARDLTQSRSRIEPATAAGEAAVRPRKPEKAGGDRAPRAIRAGHRLRKRRLAACGAGTVPNRSYLTACPGGYWRPAPGAGASRGNSIERQQRV